MRIRIIAAALLVGAFVALVVVAGRELGVERTPELATPVHLPTLEVGDPIVLSGEADVSARLTAIIDSAAGSEFNRASRYDSRYVSDYAEAEEASGWRLLRHPEPNYRDIQIVTFDGEIIEVREYVPRDGGDFTIEQWIDIDEETGLPLDVTGGDSSTVLTGAYNVVYFRLYSDTVYARFDTGASFDGKPIVAEVSGPDVHSVILFVSQLTFRDN